MSPSPTDLVLCARCGRMPPTLPEHDHLCDGCRARAAVGTLAPCERCGLPRCGTYDGTVCNPCRTAAFQAEQARITAHVTPRERPVPPVPDEAHTCQALYGARCRWRRVTATTLKCLRCGAIRPADDRYGYV